MITSEITKNQGLRVSIPNIKILNNFASLRAELAQTGGGWHAGGVNDVFASLEWFELLVSYGLAAPDQSPAACQLIVAHDSARQCMVCLPLMGTRHISSLSNYYSSLYGGLSWSAQSAAAALNLPSSQDGLALSRGLRQLMPTCLMVNLSPLDIESAFFNQMRAALAQAGYWVDSYFCFGNWYLDVAGRTFADYYPTLPSALRHSIERGQRRLARQGPWRIQIQQHADDSLGAATRAFVQVYAQSWKSPEPNAQFIPELIKLATTQGWLRLGILTLGEQPVAAQLWLVKGGKAHIFKLAYAGGFERFSAGSVLTQAMMHHVLDVDRVQEVDYLSGDDAYKRDWMSHRRERHGLVAFAPNTLHGVWLAAKHFAGKWLRARRKA
jgi:hypothetical protein